MTYKDCAIAALDRAKSVSGLGYYSGVGGAALGLASHLGVALVWALLSIADAIESATPGQ